MLKDKNDISFASGIGVFDKWVELEIFLIIQNIDICIVIERNFTRESYLKIRAYKSYYNTYHPSIRTRGGCNSRKH